MELELLVALTPHLPFVHQDPLPGVKHRVESKRRDLCVPRSPQHHVSVDSIPSDGSGLGGCWPLSGMCDLMMGSWHNASPHPGPGVRVMPLLLGAPWRWFYVNPSSIPSFTWENGGSCCGKRNKGHF